MIRHRVQVQAPAEPEDRDAFGEPDDLWRVTAEAWALVQPMSGSRLAAAQALVAEASYEVWLRWRPGMNPRMRFGWESRLLNILWVGNPDGKRIWLKCLCSEEVVT